MKRTRCVQNPNDAMEWTSLSTTNELTDVNLARHPCKQLAFVKNHWRCWRRFYYQLSHFVSLCTSRDAHLLAFILGVALYAKRSIPYITTLPAGMRHGLLRNGCFVDRPTWVSKLPFPSNSTRLLKLAPRRRHCQPS